MSKPSTLRSARRLVGDFNIEQVIEGIALACISRDDRWQALPVHEVEVGWGGRPDPVPWDLDAAFKEWCRIQEMLRTAGVGKRQETPADARAALLDQSTAGRLMRIAVVEGWVRWVDIDGQLGIELTERTLGAMEARRFVA
jgi:hypothetical protein